MSKNIQKTIKVESEIVGAFDLLSNKTLFIRLALEHFANSDKADCLFLNVEKAQEILNTKNSNTHQSQNKEKIVKTTSQEVVKNYENEKKVVNEPQKKGMSLD